eukprot:scaffold27585_cov19-Tisochrysis_lutea.AAC.1
MLHGCTSAGPGGTWVYERLAWEYQLAPVFYAILVIMIFFSFGLMSKILCVHGVAMSKDANAKRPRQSNRKQFWFSGTFAKHQK